VAAAADLYPLRDELSQAIAQTAGVTVRFTFGGSGILARQIENGAPYDVYLSANESFVKDLESRGKLVSGSAAVYGYGRLGLWSKSGKIKNLNDLVTQRIPHLALPNPAHAPYGAAARDMLRSLGLWQALEARVVYGENVEQALQFAESGNADACITAWSLLRLKGAVLLGDSFHPPIRQVGAVVASSAQREAAARVLGFLTSSAGRDLLVRYGFSVP